MRRHCHPAARLLPALALLALPGCAWANPTAGFDRAAWQQDYQLLKQTLQQRYSHLAWMASPQSGIDLPALDRQAQAALRQARDDAEARQAIIGFQQGFRDGHFSLLANTPSAAESSGRDEPAPRDLARDKPLDGCAALGYEQDSKIGFSLPFETLPGFHLTSDGLSESMRSGLADLGRAGQAAVLRIPTFSPKGYPLACQRVWRAAMPQTGAFDSEKLFQLTYRQWFADVAQRLAELRQAGARVLILDVGNNPGGNDSGDAMTRLLTPGVVRSPSLWMARSPAGKAYLDQWIEDLSSGLPASASASDKAKLQGLLQDFRQKRAELDSRPAPDMSWVWREQRRWDPQAGYSRLIAAGYASGAVAHLEPGSYSREVAETLFWPAQTEKLKGAWQGPVYIVADQKTYSAAEMFVAVSRDNGLAKIVGARTGGDGCGFMGKLEPLLLPHSGLRLRIPDCVRLRADGGDEVAGIQPDLPVPAQPGESRRARAQKTLQAIAADLLAQP
ncbi:hypothetical protein KIF53_07865 [Chromobacterium subtsugae]|uniref:Tail specific protease domain-containing protein n=1 Tax=Chromobacterium subtsugae TaxID=251747 RepID=A0ABS7FC15_9NEIS|nr:MULTISPECIES: S41 family peptidase [Chromobacterium]MBW7567376.1 hypothetical protein [Chromobacterium subtsugae]MBW8287542.1 hypothetical protein [Chromobacterium subtsugae]WSE93497.1 S41 family peptidase [Chromobacterium subtsugae]WVH61875.1 S41 family peptidase [Chromobacterium subtsugae]